MDLANRKVPVRGIIHNVYLFGAPIEVDAKKWHKASQSVSGKIYNGYHSNDWVPG